MIKPLFDRVIVKPKDVSRETKTGIIIPEEVGNDVPDDEGTVVAIGEDVGWVKVKDRVLFNQYGHIRKKIDGIDYLIIKESDVIGVF